MYIPCACSHSKTHHTFCFPSISLSISTDCTLLVSRVSDAVLFSRSARSGTFFSLVCVCVCEEARLSFSVQIALCNSK